MFLKLIMLSIILVAIIMLALEVKLWFNPNAKFSGHSCALDDGNLNDDGTCFSCHVKDLSDCPEKKKI